MTDIPEDVMQAAREALALFETSSRQGGAFFCSVVSRALIADREKRMAVKPLEWHELLRRGPREGFVCSVGGVLSYFIMLGRNRVYGIRGEHDGAAEFRSLEEAMTAAQADYERRILATLEFTDEHLEDDPDALTVAYMAGEAKAKERLVEADAERLAEALRDVDTWLSEPVDREDLDVARHQVRLALAAHEARKGERHE